MISYTAIEVILKDDNYQSPVSQPNMVSPFFGMGLLCLEKQLNKLLIKQQKKSKNSPKTARSISKFLSAKIVNKIILIGYLSVLVLPKLAAQNCDYLPGTVILNSSLNTNSSFYKTMYFIINTSNDSILQIAAQPNFTNLTRGTYAAYVVTYKVRDSIINLAIGHTLGDIAGICLAFSNPYVFKVCSPPQLSNLEITNLEVCADGTKIELTDSLNFIDNDNLLDTFSIIVSITGSPDLANDFLDVDLDIFIGLEKEYTAPTLIIRNIRSPMQVQTILRAIFFYTNGLQGNRTISIQVIDGLAESTTLNRTILVSPLPNQSIQIFRKRGNEE